MNSKIENCSFGYIDTNTGKFKSGHINNSGKMYYKNPLPWYKRIFGFKSFVNIWESADYVGTFTRTENYLSNPMFGESKILKNSYEIALYKERNIFSLKYRYFYIDGGARVYINSVAFERDWKIVLI